jgi:hypothetical protein
VAGQAEGEGLTEEAVLPRAPLPLARPGGEGRGLRRRVREVVQRATGLAQRVAGRQTAIAILPRRPSAMPELVEEETAAGMGEWTPVGRPDRRQPIGPLVPAGGVQRHPAERRAEVTLTPGPSPSGWEELTLTRGPAPRGRGELVVQRTVATLPDLRQALQPTLAPTDVQAARPGEVATGPATEETAGEGAGSQDVEAMAQEVYRIIRRRLAVERERERGRT